MSFSKKDCFGNKEGSIKWLFGRVVVGWLTGWLSYFLSHLFWLRIDESDLLVNLFEFTLG